MNETAQTLADQLSDCADTISARLAEDIAAGKIDQNQANTILEKIAVLRQQADALYMEAIIQAVETQKQAQEKLQGLINEANDKIKTIQNVAIAIDLAADVIELAANGYAGDVKGILESLSKLRDDIDAIQSNAG